MSRYKCGWCGYLISACQYEAIKACKVIDGSKYIYCIGCERWVIYNEEKE